MQGRCYIYIYINIYQHKYWTATVEEDFNKLIQNIII